MTHEIYPDPRATTIVFAELEMFTDYSSFKLAAEKSYGKPIKEDLRSFIYENEEMFRAGNFGKLFLLVDKGYSGIFDAAILAQEFYHKIVVPANKMGRMPDFDMGYQTEAIATFTENLYRQILEARNKEFFVPQ